MILMGEGHNKIQLTSGTLGWLSLLCFCFVGFRVVYAGATGYVFLVWNLFLAWLPLLFADAVYLFEEQRNRARFWLFAFLWLIFFPNAPYIVTDFIHLDPWATVGVPWWFDFLLISSFAIAGGMLGLCSLQTMSKITGRRFGPFWSWGFMVVVSLLSGFGIYLGRYLRWNSWDVVLNPSELISDVGERISQPFLHPETWFISLLFGALVLSSYLVFAHFFEYRRQNKPIRHS